MTLRLTLAVLTFMTMASVAVAQESRMPGRQPGSSESPADTAPIKNTEEEAPKADARPDANNAVVKTPAVKTPQPRTGRTMDRKALESLGPLTNPLEGGLGDDMWSGSTRAVIENFIPQMPTGDTLSSIQRLTRRVLLSNGDAGLLRGDRTADDGEDLFTLRLEKLLQMGAYNDAVDLYTLIEGEPSHDRLARAGVMALMFNGAPAQACLEVRAAHRDKPETPDSDAFWPQLEAACSFIQAESVKTLKDPALKVSSPVREIPGSKVLSALVNRSDYRHSITSPRDLGELSDVERAVLRGLGRFDYTRLKLKHLAEIPSPILMTMAGDTNLLPVQRLSLNQEAAERGLLDDDGLGRVYQTLAKETNPTIDSATTESAPTTLYERYAAAARPEAEGSVRNALVTSVLEASEGARLSSLYPFAGMVSAINPGKLSKTAVRTGLTLMLLDGISPPERWIKAWIKSESPDSDQTVENLMLYLANLVSENLPTESETFYDNAVKTFFEGDETAEKLDVYAVFAGLGLTGLLHNNVETEIYEKDLDLTTISNYVMPIDSVLEKLRDASKNDRLGETILLATVALKTYDPEKTHPGILRDVLKSLNAVGLKEEARAVAVEVILGSNNK